MSRKSPTMPRTPIAIRPRGGFTLLELSIASVVLLIVLGAMVRALTSGSSAFEEGTSVAEADANAQRLLDRIADELRDADFSTFAPAATAPFGSDSLTFNRGRGWAAGALVHGPTQILRSVIDTGELDNGVDDNGNGLIDERRVELVPDVATPAQVFVIGHFVREFAVGELQNGNDDNGNGLRDEGGLSFLSDGNSTLTVRLTIERPTRQGRSIVRTLQTTVRPRNQ
ncbi:MAG: prepilin-type N-terminal cleavage/methylation domain-containing protein [Planctomycetes bacterium]|nr:prepilin-type N-terminal cleavage/methylation domain-containing protein [Planctomycetota bacterium]